MVTIFKNIFDNTPHYITISKALERIKSGNSKDKVEEIRKQLDKERANKLKCNLPSVCFSGKFEKRTDAGLLEHSGFICLDFDNVDVIKEKETISKNKYTHACWVSPSGNGLKVLVKIASKDKHREHFEALQDVYKNIDKSGINISRVCYESFDNEIFINENSETFKQTKKAEKVVEPVKIENNAVIFEKVLKWLTNKGDAFVKGERNVFVFKLASACSRFGIQEQECYSLCKISFLTNEKSFSDSELGRTIKSAYRANSANFGTAEFVNDVLIDKVTRGEIQTKEINPDIFNLEIKPKDVIFGEDVKSEALDIYENGYQDVESMGIRELDEYFKLKKGEITLLTGHGNYGKSSFLKYILILKLVKFGKKFAFFSPEDNPAQEFYHDLVEIYLGCDCTPKNPNKPNKMKYEHAYDFISKNIFYVYPKEIAPTPDYIKERFLELIIKEKVDGVIIDPFNQMTNDYGARSDKYLETFLSDCSRFAQINNVYFIIVAHPKAMKLDDSGSYPCPNVFDVADGAMWNNKMDNILVYHRPDHQTNPNGTICELHTKKIRRQKTVGKKGEIKFELMRSKRRFFFNGYDYLDNAFINIQPSLIENTNFLSEKAVENYQGDVPF